MESLLILSCVIGAVFLAMHVIDIVLLHKTRKEIAQYVHYVEKFESEKVVEHRFLVFGTSYRECEQKWISSKFSKGLPKTAAKFITFDNCPAAVRPYWNDVHFKRVTLIGITLREFDKLYYGN